MIIKCSVLRSVRRTELKEPEITKSSSAIRSAANQANRISWWTYCTAIDFTATSSAVEIINRFINLKLTNISTFNNEFTITEH